MREWAAPRVKGMRAAILAAACVLALAAHLTDCSAAVVTVTPERMEGWSIEAFHGGQGELSACGPAVFERGQPFLADDGTTLGRGAFYAACAQVPPGGTPSTVWLGLDVCQGRPLAGIALRRLTRLEYYAYVAHIPTGTSGVSSWESWSLWWTYPRQPLQLQLTAASPDGRERRQFWFLPWHAQKLRGDNSGRHCKKWLRYDCIRFSAPGPNMLGRWYCPEPEQVFACWDDLIAVYGDWRLAPTSDEAFPRGWKSPGWDSQRDPPGSPACSGTGKCLNFQIGARSARAKLLLEDEDFAWANDTRGFRGYVDHFTLGIDGEDVTFDFEPAGDAFPSLEACGLPRVGVRVAERTNVKLTLDDGSERPLKLFLYRNLKDAELVDEHAVEAGDYLSIQGLLEPVPFGPPDRPPCIWTAVEHIRRIR